MKKILITGADRSIGLELVKQSLKNDYKVVATYHGTKNEELKALNKNKSITLFDLDVTSQQSINQLVRQLNKKTIDVIIHNTDIAGPQNQNLEDMDFELWQHTFNMNAIAPFAVTQAMIPMLQRSNQPKVISLYNQSAKHTTNMYAHQSALAAQNKIMLMLANELKPQDIIVCPVQLYREKSTSDEIENNHMNEVSTNILKLVNNLKIEDSGKSQFLIGQDKIKDAVIA